jgi:hypothetical protein
MLACMWFLLFVPVNAALSGGGGELTAPLREPLPLALRYDVGETIHYRLLRHSIFFHMDGAKFGEHKALAHFTRTRLDDDAAGKVQERFTWKSFSVGQSMSPGEALTMKYLPEAEDFSITCSVQDESLLEKFDFSALPRTLEGMWFMIMSWDAVTFDGPVRRQDGFEFPDAAPIGTTVRCTGGAHEFEFEYPPIVTDSRYEFSGNMEATVLGVGVVKSIPCAIVQFSDAENRIRMNLDLGAMQSSSKGFEHFWGRTYLSLGDGRIVRGELAAPVAHVQDMSMEGLDEPMHNEFMVVQRLYLDMLSPDEFAGEVEETRKDVRKQEDQ